MKKCIRCGTEYASVEEGFYRKGGAWETRCKACCRALKRAKYWADPEKHRAALRRRAVVDPAKRAEHNRRYNEANRERIRAQQKEYRDRNPELLRERHRRFRERHPGYFREYESEHRPPRSEEQRARFKEYSRRWAEQNRDKKRAAKQRRRAHETSASGDHTDADIQRQYRAQKGRCYWCRKKCGEHYHVDHVVPLSRGGSNGPENLVIACRGCNSRKAAKLPSEFAGMLDL